MPLYNYLCGACGDFEAWRGMKDFAKPAPCPECGADPPRAVSAPRLSIMDSGNRKAHTINERSAAEPKVERRSKGGHNSHDHGGHSHGFGHAHAGSRPWMIGH